VRVALAQLNQIVGDLEGNVDRIAAAARTAHARGAQLLVAPELAVPGYPPMDLMFVSSFVERNHAALDRLAGLVPPDLPVLAGFVDRNPEVEHGGKSLLNAAALVHAGHWRRVATKTLLPTYDVFDEGRYFEPCPDPAVNVLAIAGVSVGVTICEDLWNDREFWVTRLYRADPVAREVTSGARLLVNLSSSPWSAGRERTRLAMVGHAARRHAVPIVYANQVGGNDSLLFDGRSFAVDARGRLVALGGAFVEDLVFVDTDADLPEVPSPEPPFGEVVHDALVMGIRDYFGKLGLTGAVIGLSGGIDSALTAVLAARALGPEHVVGLSMPSRFSSDGSKSDAQALADALGIRMMTLPIEPLFAGYLESLAPVLAGRPPDVTEENLQARIRGNFLMAYSNRHGAVVLATGNKSELAMGYCTIYGDMCGGLAVLSDLFKTEVYEVSAHVNRAGEVIPRATIEKPPSAELRPDQRDDQSLPPYPVLDPILRALIVDELGVAEAARATGAAPALVAQIARTVSRNEFKRRQAPPTLRVSAKAWYGRMVPIAHRWRE
jgi:NAD+ synthase/NAD+ synthase (glutamine-hydrolysing)